MSRERPNYTEMARQEVWDWLRLSRATPPGAASDAHDAPIYRASLQQFEDLMRAAEMTGPAGRPLPLYYAVSQAGRVLQACRGEQAPRSHGLTIKTAEPLLDALVKPNGNGQFQAVSACLESATLPRAAPLGALMASLPELATYLPEDAPWPHPLAVWAVDEQHPSIHWQRILVTFEGDPSATEIDQILAAYPEASGRLRRASQFSQTDMTPDYQQATQFFWNKIPDDVATRLDPEILSGGDALVAEYGQLEACFPEYRRPDRRWLRPAVVPDYPPPSPLMTWWIILYALSMAARYDPVSWVRSLEVDSSPIAVLLSRCMTEALDAVPVLVLDAIHDLTSDDMNRI